VAVVGPAPAKAKSSAERGGGGGGRRGTPRRRTSAVSRESSFISDCATGYAHRRREQRPIAGTRVTRALAGLLGDRGQATTPREGEGKMLFPVGSSASSP